MLDALKGLAGGGKAAQKQAEELEALIASTREERSELAQRIEQSIKQLRTRTVGPEDGRQSA